MGVVVVTLWVIVLGVSILGFIFGLIREVVKGIIQFRSRE